MPADPDGRRSRAWTTAAALLLALAVALGAFGAHALEGRVTPSRLATFETAVRYQALHGLGLLAIVGLRRDAALRAAAPLVAAGTVLFCGSLYALVATDAGAWGAVAPVGGVLLVAGWSVLAWTAWRS